MSNAPVVSVTDELIAELERAKQDDAGRIYCNGNVWMGQGPASRCGEIWGSIIQCAKCKELESKRSLIEQIKSLLAEREELKRDAKRLSEIAEQANVNCKNTAYYLRKYRPDLADICSGWCAAIDAAMQS